MRVDLLDPPAYSPPYDHALATALAGAGADVRLVTSRFAYGDAPPPAGYQRDELFYRHALGPAGSRLRALSKRAEHPLDMLRYRRAAEADVVHFQWLTVPRLDLRLLPDRPTVLTIHDPVRATGLDHLDAVIVHSQYARDRVLALYGLDPARVHVIHHGVFRNAPYRGKTEHSLPSELHDTDEPVVLSYGLIRPYKGIETLIGAWRGIEGAQLWIVGRPMMDLKPLRSAAQDNVQIVERFVNPAEEAALFDRADIVALPYEPSERFGFSGVLATALGHGKAIAVSEIGGFTELVESGAARGVTPSDLADWHEALVALISDESERVRLSAGAARAAAEDYSWEAAARATMAVYETIAAP